MAHVTQTSRSFLQKWEELGEFDDPEVIIQRRAPIKGIAQARDLVLFLLISAIGYDVIITT